MCLHPKSLNRCAALADNSWDDLCFSQVRRSPAESLADDNMRLIVDSLIALMLVAILGTVLLHYRQQQREFEQLSVVHRALAQLHEQTRYYRAMEQVHQAKQRHTRTLNPKTAFPEYISPMWFDGELPLNVLVPLRQPWLDLAAAEDDGVHPPDPVITQPHQAGFWYNPQQGIFRARVPAQFSEQSTLDLYNRANGTSLTTLPRDDNPAREPRTHALSPGLEQHDAEGVIHRTSQIDHHLDNITEALPAMLSLTPPGESLDASEETEATSERDTNAETETRDSGEEKER